MELRKLTALACLSMGLSVAWAADLPRKAPVFEIHLADGKNLSPAQFKGKIVALALISTTCPHCQHYTQTLSVIQQEYGPRGVQILAAAFNDDARTALPLFLQQFRPAFPTGWVDRTSALSFLEISVLNQGYVPKVAFIDRDGVIQKQFEGQDPFFQDPDKATRAALEEMLKASTTTAHKKAAVKK
jgi:thiol-disulfide isomerase/thioredoxin